MKKLLFLCLLSLFFVTKSSAQQKKADSLELLLSKKLSDTLRVNILNNLSFAIYSINSPKSKEYADQALELATKNNFWQGMGMAYNNIASYYRQKGEFVKALEVLMKAVSIYEKHNYQKGLASIYIPIGLINGQQSNFVQAHTYHLKALKFYEELGDRTNVAVCLSNIGYTYFLQKEYQLALDYYFKSLPISRSVNDQWREALCYHNIGLACSKKREYDTALYYFDKAIVLSNQLRTPIGRMLIAKGETYVGKKEYQLALNTLYESLNSFKKASNQYYVAEASNSLGKTYLIIQKIDSAIYFYRKGAELAQKVGGKAFLISAYEGLSKSFDTQKNLDSAYKYQSLYIRLKDSVYNEEIFRKTAFAQFAYNLDKKQNEIALLEEKHNKEVVFRNMIIMVGLLILLGSVLLYKNRSKIKRTNQILNWQNIEILQKTQEIVLKNNEILQKNDEIMVQNEELRQQQEEILAQRDDISIKKQELELQKEKIEAANRNMEIISEIGQQITSTLNLEKAIMILYKNINKIMDADEFGIGTYNPLTRKISYDFYIFNSERLPYFQSSIDDDRFSSWVIKEQKPVFFGDIRNEYHTYIKDFSYYEDDLVLHSMICIPLLIEDRIIGLISVQSLKKYAYTEYHLDILKALASYMSIALENIAAYGIIEQKNKNITDSIRYAQNIQQAILPAENQFKEFFQDHFIIFRPKDIVSGDFYWFSTIVSSGERQVTSELNAIQPLLSTIVAVVDCTGHGVPGAFMSMIGNTLLNEIINIEKITDTDQILENLDQKVRMALQQKDSKNQDGMDIAICRIDKKQEDYKISFSGAKNNLIYIKEGKMEVVKGNRYSIGGFRKKDGKEFFTKYEFFIPKNSILYLYSDGYVDQGNQESKRLGTQKLEKWIEEVKDENMSFQKDFFLQKLIKHQGNTLQRDDITFLGLKLG